MSTSHPYSTNYLLSPLLAWIGLGSDGLSSSSYGPEEAFRALGQHTYLAIFIGLATALTVFIISYSCSRIIEHFPHGGGGYIVATHTISKNAGVISGCALLVDYMLTITVSLVACGDALFSFVPLAFQQYKLIFVIFLIVGLVILNLKGVKESVSALAPILIIFIITHILLIGYGILSHSGNITPMAHQFKTSFGHDISTLGFLAMLSIFLRAFSLGGGTYTGLEAVSNGMQIMREPKVQTGKRTMVYMATSLAFTAGGLFFCYYLFNIRPVEGKTLNAILADGVFGNWPLGYYIALIAILSEGVLLMVAAQARFIDGPRVMAILVMGTAALILLFYTHGSVSALIIMYSINVFLTFSLSQFGMVRFYIKNNEADKKWKQHIVVHIIGLILCLTILIITIYEKFGEGGWVTLFVTGLVVGLCYLIRSHYSKVRRSVQHLEETLSDITTSVPFNNDPVDLKDMTAILLGSGFNGFGLHTLLSIVKNFPNVYKNFIYVSVAEVDSGSFKGTGEIEALKESVKKDLTRYVKITRSHGFPADHRTNIATDVIESVTELVSLTVKEFPRSTVFT